MLAYRGHQLFLLLRSQRSFFGFEGPHSGDFSKVPGHPFQHLHPVQPGQPGHRVVSFDLRRDFSKVRRLYSGKRGAVGQVTGVERPDVLKVSQALKILRSNDQLKMPL